MNPEPSTPTHAPETTNLVSKVDDDEGGIGHARLLEMLAGRMSIIELLGPVLVGSFGHLWNPRNNCFVKREMQVMKEEETYQEDELLRE